MGFFRRKTSTDDQVHKQSRKKGTQRRFVEQSIGEELDPRDHFFLEIPRKKPIDNGTLHVNDFHVNAHISSEHDIGDSSTVSSLTQRSWGLSSPNGRAKSRSGRWGGACCSCTFLPDNEERDTNSINKNGHEHHHERTNTQSPLTESTWSDFLCGQGSPDTSREKVNSDKTILTSPIRSPRSEVSLFDSLEGEADYLNNSTLDGNADSSLATKTSRWRRLIPQVRSIPKLRNRKKDRRTTKT